MLGTLVTAAVVVWQIGRQRRNELDLQVENYRNQYKLEVYREFSTLVTATADFLSKASAFPFNAVMSAKAARELQSLGMTPDALREDAHQLSELHSTVGLEAAETIQLIEKYLIVEPDLDVFKLAINAAIHDLHAAYFPLHSFLMMHFPIRSEGKAPVNIKVLDSTQIDELQQRANEYHACCVALGAYYDDLILELQIRLLGKLFQRTLPRRQPLDPRYITISLEPEKLQGLREHFLERTAWGKRSAQEKAAFKPKAGTT